MSTILSINSNDDYDKYLLQNNKNDDIECLEINHVYNFKNTNYYSINFIKDDDCGCSDDDCDCGIESGLYINNNGDVEIKKNKFLNYNCYNSLSEGHTDFYLDSNDNRICAECNDKKCECYNIFLDCLGYTYNYQCWCTHNYDLNEIIINVDNYNNVFYQFLIYEPIFYDVKKMKLQYISFNNINEFISTNKNITYLKYFNNLTYLEITKELIDSNKLKIISKKCKLLKYLYCSYVNIGICLVYHKEIDYICFSTKFDGKCNYSITSENKKYNYYGWYSNKHNKIEKNEELIKYVKKTVFSILPQLEQFNIMINHHVKDLKNDINYKYFYESERKPYHIDNFYMYKIYKNIYKLINPNKSFSNKFIFQIVDLKQIQIDKKEELKIQLTTKNEQIINLKRYIKIIHKNNNFDNIYDISNLFQEYDYEQIRNNKKELHLEFKFTYKYFKKMNSQKRFIQEIIQ